MKTHVSLATIALLLLGSVAYAQSSGSIGTSKLSKMRDVKGSIYEIDLEINQLTVQVTPDRLIAFSLPDKIKLKADKKSPLAGKKKLELTDLQKDLFIKVSYRENEPAMALEIRIMEQPAAKQAGS